MSTFDASSRTPDVLSLSGTVCIVDHICSFLTPQDRAPLLSVPELSVPFQLGERFCPLHGSTLDQRCVQQRDNSNNDDLSFLIWYLEQEAFLGHEEHPDVPSLSPDCLDCRMARFHGQKKCACCNEYENHENFGTCMGSCEFSDACEDCHEGIFQCALCENGATYCRACFYESDGYYCDSCGDEFCSECRPKASCTHCAEYCCKDCIANSEMFECGECKEIFHLDCQDDSYYCNICEKMFCGDCRENFWCQGCENHFCSEVHYVAESCCSRCLKSFCSRCNETIQCEKCLECFCYDCKPCCTCRDCGGKFCDDCRDFHYCVMCDNEFCVECKDGYRVCGEWSCIDCLRNRSGLLDELVSNQNEAEGNMCANCFLSKDDMEGVTLKQCSSCKTTKYCSRACQKAHWKEHRDQCRRVSETKVGSK